MIDEVEWVEGRVEGVEDSEGELVREAVEQGSRQVTHHLFVSLVEQVQS